jgi:PEP-CTERM motif
MASEAVHTALQHFPVARVQIMQSRSRLGFGAARFACALALAVLASAPAVAEVSANESFASLSLPGPVTSNMPAVAAEPTVVVPEPGAFVLMAFGLAAIGLRALRARR